MDNEETSKVCCESLSLSLSPQPNLHRIRDTHEVCVSFQPSVKKDKKRSKWNSQQEEGGPGPAEEK